MQTTTIATTVKTPATAPLLFKNPDFELDDDADDGDDVGETVKVEVGCVVMYFVETTPSALVVVEM